MSMTKIQQVTVGAGGASTITFSEVPQIYTDLMLVLSDSTNRSLANDGLVIRPNNETITNRHLYGTGNSTVSGTEGGFQSLNNSSFFTANTFSNHAVYFSNYRSSASKSISVDSVTENNATQSFQWIAAGLYSSSAAITSIVLQPLAGTIFLQHSSATLYGINRTQAIGKPKAIGGNITFANGHWVHTFTGSGTFSTQEDLEVEALVVAGGGGGGIGNSTGAGGGGAGGYLLQSINLSKNANCQVAVGSGGAGSSSIGINGVNGGNSLLDTLTAIGGGGGGSIGGPLFTPGNSGGSGGGGMGGYDTSSTQLSPGGAGVSGQGFAGGAGRNHPFSGDSAHAGGGGGGALSAGANASDNSGGAGGSAASSSITGAAVLRAGGGGGGKRRTGTAGLGGGGGAGNGGLDSAGSPATTNTGSGGGGGASAGGPQPGGNGGSGVVIIRYRAD